MTDIKVSVVCLTYNHEKYIGRAIEGFVMQKTDFPYEVIVHDDYSTDATADVIREYEKKYPELLRVVYQPKNIRSRGIDARTKVITPMLRGEYVALCEGDDFWTDENKLQIQYDYLKSHPECSMCVHQTTLHDLGKNTDRNQNVFTEDRIFTVKDILALGGRLFSVNSILMKRKIYTDIPKCLDAKGFGDFQLFLNGALNGEVYYMARNMATRNHGVEGSWTQRVMFDKYKTIEHFREVIRMLNTFNEAYDYKYDSVIKAVCVRYEYGILKNQGKYFAIKKDPYSKCYLEDLKRYSAAKFFVRCIIYRFDFLYKLFKKSKERRK